MSTILSESIFQLVYISQSIDSLSYQDIQNILSRSRIENKKNNITGLLIYRDGFFLQFLEGVSEKEVKTTLARIICDSRHHTLRIINEWTYPKRIFPDWQMGFYDSDICKKNDLFQFIDKIFSDFMLMSSPQQSDLLNFFEKLSQDELQSNVKI